MRKHTFLLLAFIPFLFFSCQKSCKFWLHNEFKDELHYDEHQIISLTVTNTGDVSQPKFIVDDQTIATVDERGFLRAVSIGNTQIHAYSDDCNTEQVFNFTVIPYYNIYDSPIRDWGKSKSHIRSLEKREFKRENGDTLVYVDPIYNFEIKYYFENNQLKKCFAGRDSWPQGQNGLIFLEERYEVYNENSYNRFYWDRKRKDYILGTNEQRISFHTYQPQRPY